VRCLRSSLGSRRESYHRNRLRVSFGAPGP
jgi:hypothetical protein